ncbi:tRNA (uracil-O(2)-)-methyltransferase [Sphaceloma murrayae]|uniref:tRNA (uracil-O(2)-)-methyltransferase n=1 Tax=Sphaceloma murrayae TaxID=2082308 RepID=A0A2K1QJ14_9PEZI|nr:tRNA (uracil-O(2)-)-methyltransferase [Sphaceloma murrayae]
MEPRPELLLEGSLPDNWTPTSWMPVTFQAQHFARCMQNLLRNPNLTSTHLFRADILYDSDSDKAVLSCGGDLTPYGDQTPQDSLARHMKAGLRPKTLRVKDFQWQRTVVRELIPRNRQLDKPMVQTVHMFTSQSPNITSSRDKTDRPRTSLVFYLPHVDDPEAMPFYHPTLQGICFVHVASTSCSSASTPAHQNSPWGAMAIHVLAYPSQPPSSLEPKLTRIILSLLTTISKHSHGAQEGYEKRVQHDVVIPQKRFQERYARLKERYAKEICQGWREVTDPGKHVFEDLGIAAFLSEVWEEMYELDGEEGENAGDEGRKGRFPGFVDIGCGNGLLVHILRQEGFEGWGFDVRKRKSWAMYPEATREMLKVATLVPEVLLPASSVSDRSVSNGVTAIDPSTNGPGEKTQHSGIFQPGTFIVSNHADELTAWTPLLAYLNDSPWIAIPCCSHDLGGQRFRAPKTLRTTRDQRDDKQEASEPTEQDERQPPAANRDDDDDDDVSIRARQAAETGSLRHADPTTSLDEPSPQTSPRDPDKVEDQMPHRPSKSKPPSAYASLCNYVSLIAVELGYEPEVEMLRIPSTRNTCVLGRGVKGEKRVEDIERRKEAVKRFVEMETRMPVEELRRAWLLRAGMISGKQGEGH